MDITENIKKKKELIEKYKFDDEIKAIVKLTEMFVKWQDDRKLRTLMHSSFAQKYLDEVSRRSKVDVDLLKYAKYDEIKDVLNGKLDVDVLSERKKGVMWVYRKEGVEMIIGDEAKNMFEKASKVNVKGDEVDGFCASPGKAVGNVKVVLKVEDADDFEEGDVLVIGMTRPEHIVAMKKSAAIVTDDGGITCHAAIVSRELGKPCVIGTKVATKVFKDGDKVEVDADNGKVKKV